jgi:citrate synthase
LADLNSAHILRWLKDHQAELETIVGSPLAMTGVAAAGFIDLGFTPEQGEMLFLLLRLPGAAAHALEQEHFGWRRFPFFSDKVKVDNDPKSGFGIDNINK